MTIAYDGTAYLGWQVQVQGPTVQSALEEALLKVTEKQVRATASGRTDTGVHALGQVVGAKVDTKLDNHELCRALNATTPFDIKIIKIEDAPSDFDPIRSAKRKRYRYRLQHSRQCDLFDRDYSWHIPQSLDVPGMRAAAKHILGTHDFVCFQTSGSERATTTRTIMDLQLMEHTENDVPKLEIEVEADGFLYNMVRAIVGTLVEVGRGKRNPDSIPELISGKDRCDAGMTAPACGLFLLKVDYDEGPTGQMNNGAGQGSKNFSA